MSDMGMITTVWGPCLWEVLHTITFAYPTKPTKDDKRHYTTFFCSLKYVLPCIHCRESFGVFISTSPTKLVPKVLENRDNLTHWLYLIHQRVNNKLGVDYGVTFDHVKERYESFRAKCNPDIKDKCTMTPDMKIKTFTNLANKECPVVPTYIVKAFSEYAKKRNVSFANINKYDAIQTNIKSPEWIERNKECRDIITRMRLNGTPSFEPEGEYKGMPTIDELQLLSRLCSMNDVRLLEKKIK